MKPLAKAEGTIILHKYNAAWGLPDVSPFCIKVETYLRMARLPFRTCLADSRSAPRGKLPYVEHAGKFIPDSRDIVAHFEALLSRPLDAGLSASDRALTAAFRGLFESELYFCEVYRRWQSEPGWNQYQPALHDYATQRGLPRVLRPLLLRMVRKRLVRDLWGQGTGRRSSAEVDARACEALEAAATQLGPGPYFLGATPRTIDATVFAFVWSLLDAPFESPVRERARGLGNLVDYVRRMRAVYFAQPAGAGEGSEPIARQRLAGTIAAP